MTEMILLKLGELVLKGANRHTFEDKLKANIARRLRPLGKFKVYTRQSTTCVGAQSDGCGMEEACLYLRAPRCRCAAGRRFSPSNRHLISKPDAAAMCSPK